MIDCFGLSLEDILRSHTLLCSFIEFLDQYGARKFLEFVISVDSFITELSEFHTNENNKNENFVVTDIQDDAMVIYDRYFSMQASEPLEFGDTVRVEIETKICTDDGSPSKDVFDKAPENQQPSLSALSINKNPLSSQRNSISFLNHYDSYLLAKTALNIEDDDEQQSCCSTSSTIGAADQNPSLSLADDTTTTNSSEDNFSLRDSSNHKKTANSRVGKHLQFDSQTTNDYTRKNSLHRSKSKTRPSALGKVDQFGRYTSMYDNTIIDGEDINATSRKNKLKNTLDKLLNQTAANECLLADEVAQLIIGDIQKMVAVGNSTKQN